MGQPSFLAERSRDSADLGERLTGSIPSEHKNPDPIRKQKRDPTLQNRIPIRPYRIDN